jgi:hypothetical protein
VRQRVERTGPEAGETISESYRCQLDFFWITQYTGCDGMTMVNIKPDPDGLPEEVRKPAIQNGLSRAQIMALKPNPDKPEKVPKMSKVN